MQPQDVSPEAFTDSQLAVEIAYLEGWQDEQLAGTPSLGPSTQPADRNRRLERLAQLRQERQRRLTYAKLDDDPRPFTEQVQDPARRGEIKELFGRWLEINAPELDAYIAGALVAELEQLVGELWAARTDDRELLGFIRAVGTRVAGELDGSLEAPRVGRPEYRARLAAAVRERLIETGTLRSRAVRTELSITAPVGTQRGTASREATVRGVLDTRHRGQGSGGPREHVIRGKTRTQSIQQCAEVARAHRKDGLTLAELAEQYKVDSQTTIKRWIRWHDDDVDAGIWPLNSSSEP